MADRTLRCRKSRRATISILCSLAAAFAGGLGCANDAQAPDTNTVRFELDFGSGVTLTSVDYVLTRSNGDRRTGSLTVGDQPIVTATFQNLPPGQGYNIQVRGTATDGETRCQGELTFNVTPAMTTTLQIPLTCQGVAAVTATFNLCPVIDSLSAIPAEVAVGGSIELAVVARDDDNGPDPLSALWATTGGALSNLSTAGATFTCTAPGTFTVGVRISDGDRTNKCPDASRVNLVCTEGLQ